MGWWYDVKRSESSQGIEVISIKEVAKGSLDDQKEKRGMYVFDRLSDVII